MLFDNGEGLNIAMAEEIKGKREAGGVHSGLAVVGGAALDEESHQPITPPKAKERPASKGRVHKGRTRN